MPSREMACSRRGAPVRLCSPAPQVEKKEPKTITQGEGQASVPTTRFPLTASPNLKGKRGVKTPFSSLPGTRETSSPWPEKASPAQLQSAFFRPGWCQEGESFPPPVALSPESWLCHLEGALRQTWVPPERQCGGYAGGRRGPFLEGAGTHLSRSTTPSMQAPNSTTELMSVGA